METELLGKPEIELVENELDLEKMDLPRKPLPKLLVRATHGSAMGASMLRVGSLLDRDQQLSESLSIG